MKLVRTAFFSAIITFIRIVSGFLAGKFVAIVTGPPGVALIGAFSNFISTVLAFSNGGISSGIIKYTSEYGNDDFKIKSLFSTSLKITVYCSVVIGLILISFAPVFSESLFRDIAYSNPIRVLGLTMIFYSLNSLLISILNGLSKIKIFTVVNTIGSLVGLIVTLVLVYFYRLPGALYALVLSQTIVFFVTLFLIVKSEWFNWSYFNQAFDKSLAIKLSHYSLMAIVTALTTPVAQIMIRNYIIKFCNLNEAGYWQGMMRVSDGYLLLITTSLSTYYLPKLSSIKSNSELKKEIFSGYKMILPVVAIGCLLVYVLRFYIISILFRKDFAPMEELFLWQLLGDFFKIAAWLLSFLLIAKSMTKVFITTEIVFSVLYVAVAFLLIGQFKVLGATIAFFVVYFVYLITMIIIFRNLIFKS